MTNIFVNSYYSHMQTLTQQSSQQNPVLEFSQSLLTEGEESVAMVTGGVGEEEEGVINDPGTEAVDNISDKARVRNEDEYIKNCVQNCMIIIRQWTIFCGTFGLSTLWTITTLCCFPRRTACLTGVASSLSDRTRLPLSL